MNKKLLCTLVCIFIMIPMQLMAQCSSSDIPNVAVSKAQKKYPQEIMINTDMYDQYDIYGRFIYYQVIIHTNKEYLVFKTNCYMDCTCTSPLAITIK